MRWNNLTNPVLWAYHLHLLHTTSPTFHICSISMRPTVNSEGNNDGHEGGNNNRSIIPSNGASHSSSLSKSTNVNPIIQREAWTVRGQLLLNFHNIISRAINSPEMIRACSQIGEDMMRVGGVCKLSPPSMAEEYSAEAALIVENKSKRDAVVRNKSLALGLFSFITIRGGRGFSAFVRRSIATKNGTAGYQLDGASPVREMNTQPSRLRRSLSLGLDVIVSTSITLLSGAFLFMPRPSVYLEDMSKLPLVEGKSVYAEMVCPPLLKEYKRVLEQYGGRWPVRTPNASDHDSTKPLTQEDVSLNVMRNFVKNCYKRSVYENALLEERNALSMNENKQESAMSRLLTRSTIRVGTVLIPSPGVPEDLPVNLDEDVLSLVPDDNEEEI